MIDLVFWFWPCRGCIRHLAEVLKMIIEISTHGEGEKSISEKVGPDGPGGA